jgi:hypothetical protein
MHVEDEYIHQTINTDRILKNWNELRQDNRWSNEKKNNKQFQIILHLTAVVMNLAIFCDTKRHYIPEDDNIRMQNSLPDVEENQLQLFGHVKGMDRT